MTAVTRKLMAGAAALAVAVVWALSGAAGAQGAEYKVSACGAESNYRNYLLTASVSDSRMSAYAACPNDGNGHYVGIAALAGIDVGTVPAFANASQTFTAPPGTTIRKLHLNAEGRTWNGNWVALLQSSNDRFASNATTLGGCSGSPGSANGCVAATHYADQDFSFDGATGVRALVGCGNFSGCSTLSTGYWPYTRAYYFMHEFAVTLDDPSKPTVSATGGGLASGKWVRGTQSIAFNATDNSGIRRTRFWVDDLGFQHDSYRGCDYAYAVPCTNLIGGEYSFDTARVPDGEHHVAVDAFDATDSNWDHALPTVRIDNHAPGEPGAPFVVGGEGWHTVNGFGVRWSNPSSAAPIDRAYYELCRTGGGGCSTSSQGGSGITRLADLKVPQPGDYTIRVWLADAAGNVSSAKTAPLHLKFDNVPPAQAQPQHRNGWVDRDHAAHVDQRIDPPVAATPPVSGIAGYAVTTNGAAPGTTANLPADPDKGYSGHLALENLAEGSTTIKARAISGAGVPSTQIGATDLHVDLSEPVATANGAPQPDRWSVSPVRLRLNASDPLQLSGMAGAPLDQQVSSGGFIRYAIDGKPSDPVRGPARELAPDGRLGYAPTAAADVTIVEDGPHVVTYAAADVAGNETAEKSISFKVDQTPPELAVFEDQQAADPRLVSVAAADRTSGLADRGHIELRRVSPTQGDWISLRTSRDGDHYYAHVDNRTLPEGDYEFRAKISDVAGNMTTGINNRNGQPEILHISPVQVGPYPTGGGEGGGGAGGGGGSGGRGGSVQASGPEQPQDANATVDTKITAKALQTTVHRKCKRSRGGKGKKRCRRSAPTRQLVHELRVPFGKAASITGTLATADGKPIADAEVVVLARNATVGADYAAESSTRTDARGGFSYRAAPGPGRTLDFHYRGNATYKHADDQVTLRVPAAATIRASKHVARNGNRVLFSGRLRGGPYPPKGKVLDLQAFYRKRWRTFATPRAGLNGKWRYRYRFQATHGVVIYKFRARVRATSDYPYELGYSKVTKVRVIGR
jgi:hypothetical protein